MTTQHPLLVVNADDGGLARETDDAIRSCVGKGVVTSVSIVMGGPTAVEMVRSLRDLDVGIGLHLNFTEGRALGGPYRTLTNAAGDFLGPKERFWMLASHATFDPDEIAEETLRQWDRLVDLGVEPDHVDTHNHTHVYPCILGGVLQALGDARVFLRISFEPECPKEWQPAFAPGHLEGTAMRAAVEGTPLRTADRFVGHLFAASPTQESLAHLGVAQPGVTEWMVHPGPRPGSSFTSAAERRAEADNLCASNMRDWLTSLGYRLVSFGAVE